MSTRDALKPPVYLIIRCILGVYRLSALRYTKNRGLPLFVPGEELILENPQEIIAASCGERNVPNSRDLPVSPPALKGSRDGPCPKERSTAQMLPKFRGEYLRQPTGARIIYIP